MSDAPRVRRADKVMPDDLARETIARGYSGRLGTVGPDGWPYVVPLLSVRTAEEIWVQSTRERGHRHLRANVEDASRVCFEVDEPGEGCPYGRFERDTRLAYGSVVVFGRIRIVEDREQKAAFFAALMDKYGDPQWARPSGFFPRLDQVTVYAISVSKGWISSVRDATRPSTSTRSPRP